MKERVMAMQSKCVLVRKCEVKRKAKAADEIIVDGKKTYSCYGFKDSRTGESVPECEECKLFYRKWW